MWLSQAVLVFSLGHILFTSARVTDKYSSTSLILNQLEADHTVRRSKRLFGLFSLGVSAGAMSLANSNRNRVNSLSARHDAFKLESMKKFNEMNEKLRNTDNLVNNVQRDIASLQQGQDRIANEIGGIRADIGNIRSGLEQTDLTIRETRGEIRAMNRDLQHGQAKIDQKVTDVQRDIHTLQSGLTRTEFTINDTNTDIKAMQRTLKILGTAIGHVEETLSNQLNQLAHRIDFLSAITNKAEHLNRQRELMVEFNNLASMDVSSPLYTSKLADWIQLMLKRSNGVQSVLLHLHDLVMGTGETVQGQTIFALYYNTLAKDDRIQSRKFKAEAFADSVLTKQSFLYNLWIKALQYNNTPNLLAEIDYVKQLWFSRMAEQDQSVKQLRYLSADGYNPNMTAVGGLVTFSIANNCSQEFLSAPALCAPSSFVFKSKMGSTAMQSCAIPSIIADCSVFVNRPTLKYSSSFLKVRNVDSETICGLFIYFGADKPDWVTLKVKICSKNTTANLHYDEDLYSMVSDESNPESFPYPYTVQSGVVPVYKGWVSEVGLAPVGDGSVRIKLQTDYFPPRLFY